MASNFITKTIDDKGIGTITLNRSEKHNAFDDTVIQHLTKAFNVFNNDNTVGCIILKANGRNFCAGADLAWMKKMINFTEEENIYDALQLSKLFQCMYEVDKPIIAQVQGKTFGGGIGLLACCDAVIIAENAEFCFSEVKYGLSPATIAPFIIAAIGARHAQYYFLTAEMFNSQTALIMGLAHRIVKESQLDEAVQQLAEKIIPHSQPAISAGKQLIRRIISMDKNIHKETARIIADLRNSPEAQKRLKMFLMKIR